MSKHIVYTVATVASTLSAMKTSDVRGRWRYDAF